MNPILIPLALCLSLTLCSACVRHSDCSTAANATGYCLRVKCIALPTDISHGSNNITLSSVKHLVNRTPLPLHLRRATLRRILHLSAELNVNDRLYRKVHHVSVRRAFQRLLRRQTDNTSTFAFHDSIQTVMASFHDLHFQYFPPPPLRLAVATLGFSVDHYFAYRNATHPRYIVSDLVPGFVLPHCIARGAHVLRVDGVPVHRVVRRLGRGTYGANDAARFRMGLDALTIRQPSQDRLPVKDTVTFTTWLPHTRSKCIAAIPWRYSVSADVQLSPSSKAIADGLPHMNRFRATPSAVHTEVHGDRHRRTYINLSEPHNLYMSASVAHTTRGDIGVLKIVGFPLRPDNDTITEFTRVLNALPRNALVIDARDNLGGVASQCAMLTNLISNVSIPRLGLTLRASRLVSDMLNTKTDDRLMTDVLERMRPGIETAREVGERYTGPVSDLVRTNSMDEYGRLERVYHGRVVTLTSALTYSAGDVFALLQRDLNASYVIGVEDSTGGGGAGFISLAMSNVSYPSLFDKPFVAGAELFLSALRYYRAGERGGALVEHFGIEPHERYWKTKADVLDSDKDLFEFVAQKLGL